jgi:TPP-dependent pyruvate/acetoin dehydrogenase alpha subunit|tara:strand:+ start:1338 stop:1559 length:222 start_codon:yes stop_codon:yes gene_type:complete
MVFKSDCSSTYDPRKDPELLKLKDISDKASKELKDWSYWNEEDISGKHQDLMDKVSDAFDAYNKRYDYLGIGF